MTVERPFEHVYTMTDWYDGPRGVVADFDGRPHAYFAEPLEEVFELRPVDDAYLVLAVEDWAIWLRWQAANRAGLTPIETHPALPADRARHDEITRTLEARRLDAPVTYATAEWRNRPTEIDRLEVR